MRKGKHFFLLLMLYYLNLNVEDFSNLKIPLMSYHLRWFSLLFLQNYKILTCVLIENKLLLYDKVKLGGLLRNNIIEIIFKLFLVLTSKKFLQ
jgi:hypothetical protein